MCAIIDASIVSEVFGGDGRPEAGKKFFEWLDRGRGLLVVGGKVLNELDSNSNFKTWRRQATLAGRTKTINKDEVNLLTENLRQGREYKSNDPHILALAQLSGARLLYTNDRVLQQDFKKPNLIDTPRGKIYSTYKNQSFRDSHKRLLGNKNLCQSVTNSVGR